jgi:hypothetical protein
MACYDIRGLMVVEWNVGGLRSCLVLMLQKLRRQNPTTQKLVIPTYLIGLARWRVPS